MPDTPTFLRLLDGMVEVTYRRAAPTTEGQTRTKLLDNEQQHERLQHDNFAGSW